MSRNTEKKVSIRLVIARRVDVAYLVVSSSRGSKVADKSGCIFLIKDLLEMA